MYRLFRDIDCLMLEINPFIETEDGELVALDAKMSFDDNALFRQGDVVELRDFDEEDPKEVEASGHGLNYIALDGIGRLHRERRRPRDGHDGRDRAPRRAPGELPRRRRRREPREDRERVPDRAAGPERAGDPREHLRRHQPLRLDRDQGVVQATRDQEIEVPVIVRLAGTNVEEGRAILDESGLELIQADDLDDAAAKAVAGGRRGVPA